MLKHQSSEDLDDKKALKDSVSASDHIEQIKENFVAPGAEIDKPTK